MKKNKGFTLIELLVVIAIIGILASVVLASLSSARAKGQAAAAQAQLSNMRAQGELYYNTNGNYGSGYSGNILTATGADITPTTNCTVSVALGASNMFGLPASSSGLDGIVKGMCGDGLNTPSEIKAYVDSGTASHWAVLATVSSTVLYCADSNGTSKTYASAPTFVAATGVCP